MQEQHINYVLMNYLVEEGLFEYKGEILDESTFSIKVDLEG